MTWTAKMVKSVTYLWKQDLSALETAAEMNKMYADWLHTSERFTRNAIIGKWNRLDLHKAPKHTPKVIDGAKLTTYRGRPKTSAEFKDIEVDAYDMATDAITFNEIEDKSCRWPITTGGFCGRPKAKKLYCQHHYDRAYQKKGARDTG